MPAVEHGVGEDCQIFGGGEQAGVSGNAAEDARVFVLHLALDDAVAESAIIGGWRDGVFQSGCRVEGRVRHAERAEDFALAEQVEGFVGEAFEHDAEDDEADVAVVGPRAGAGGKWVGKGGSQKVLTSASAEEKLFVGGQAGAMRKQHAQGDSAAMVVIIGELAGEFGDNGGDRGLALW